MKDCNSYDIIPVSDLMMQKPVTACLRFRCVVCTERGGRGIMVRVIFDSGWVGLIRRGVHEAAG